MASMQVTGASVIEVGEARATIRNGVALWVLNLLTLGILGAFWWYGVNRETRDISRALGRPLGTSPLFMAILVALWPLAWIPSIVSIYLGSRWIRTLEQGIGLPRTVRPLVAAVLVPLLFLQIIYVQRSVNELWRRIGAGDRPGKDWAAASGAAEEYAGRTRLEAERDAERFR
jgi:uncharacterized protein DUF4234